MPIGPIGSGVGGSLCVFSDPGCNNHMIVHPNTSELSYSSNPIPPGSQHKSLSDVFVPVYCTECYGTTQSEYNSISTAGYKHFVVGLACTLGGKNTHLTGEAAATYSKYSLSGKTIFCMPQFKPGKALFIHEDKNIIGEVLLYWHVHSKNSGRGYIYTCIGLRDDTFTNTIRTNMSSISKALSLRTRGIHTGAKGLIIDECSLVSVPMRQGCFAIFASQSDVVSNMVRMGFSEYKSESITAGLDIPTHKKDQPTIDSDAMIAELQAYKSLISAAYSQLYILTKAISDPEDSVVVYNLDGAKEFETKTGIPANLIPSSVNRDIDTTEEHIIDQEPVSAGMNTTQQQSVQQQPAQQHVQSTGVEFAQQPVSYMNNQLHVPQQPTQSMFGVFPPQLMTGFNQMFMPQIPQQPQPMFNPYSAAMLQQAAAAAFQPYLSMYSGPKQELNQSSSQHSHLGTPQAGVIPAPQDGPLDVTRLTEDQMKTVAAEYNKIQETKQNEIQAFVEAGLKKMIGDTDKIKLLAGGFDLSTAAAVSATLNNKQPQTVELSDVIQDAGRKKPYSKPAEKEKEQTTEVSVKESIDEMKTIIKSIQSDISKVGLKMSEQKSVVGEQKQSTQEPGEQEVDSVEEGGVSEVDKPPKETTTQELKAGLSVPKNKAKKPTKEIKSDIDELFELHVAM